MIKIGNLLIALFFVVFSGSAFGAEKIDHIGIAVKSIDEAVQLYLDGKLANLMERLH